MDMDKLERTKWIVPFKGFNLSGKFNLNFLYQEKNIYIMDNHRAALWCWYQHVNLSREYSILHIDRHADAQMVNDAILDKLPRNLFQKIDTYLNCEFSKDIPLITWDNYLSIFLALHPTLIKKLVMSIYEGKPPKPKPQLDFFSYDYSSENYLSARDKDKEQYDFNGDLILLCVSELLSDMSYLEDEEWIVNIDLDYFFCDDLNGRIIKMISDEYIFSLFDAILEKLNDGAIKTLTIALSPEYSGGWKNSVDLCNKISEHMGLSFNLDYVSDDEYLRSIDGMVQSIQEARREPDCNGVAIDKLDW